LYYRNPEFVLRSRASRADGFARQVLATTRPFRTTRDEDLEVLDVGCGYGHTAIALARSCRRVVGLEPSPRLARYGQALARQQALANVEIREQSVDDLAEAGAYDLVVLDNVLEHLPDQARALALVSRALKPGGVLYILVPNKLWPIEHHYGLPGLGYLPLPVATWYLRASGRGTDYRDASYAPTYWRLRRLLRDRPELYARFVLPADLSLTARGAVLSYRLGAALLRRLPALWAIAKAFLVVAVRR
jgi:SAM-dependent methyltransferase